MSAAELNRIQEQINGQIKKTYKNYKKTPKERLTNAYISTRLEILEEHWKEYLQNHRKLVAVQRPEDSATTESLFDNTEETYIEYKCSLLDTLGKFKPLEQVSEKNNMNKGTAQVKLPKIEIPKFSGNYSEWVSFRDLFRSLVHKNSSIDDVQKLHYLKSSVTGEAEQLLKHLPVTADNYELCWAQLESRYNNKKYLADCILKKLTSQKPMSVESSSGLKLLLDTTRECLHGITNLGINVTSWDILVIFLVKQKLDPESRKKWEQKVTESSQELPTMILFEEFLTNQFRSIEFLDSKVSKPKSTHVATSIVTCSFCSEGHKLCNCKTFAKQTTEARREFAQTHHLCFNCLNHDHSVFQCNSSTRCRLCKKKHHTLLHLKTPNSKVDQAVKNVVAAVTASTSSVQSTGEASDAPIITSCLLNTPSEVLLATALVKVQSAKNRTPVVLRSLLDQGSQASFVTESVVQMLGLRKIPETGIVCGLGGDRDSAISSKSTVLLKLQSRLDPNFTMTVKAHVLTKLTCVLPGRALSQVHTLPALSTMELADPSFGIPSKVDLLLGADVYSQILLEGLIRGPPGSVIAQNTRLGWILSGKVNASNDKGRDILSMHVSTSESNETDLLKKFWELESEPQQSKHLTQEEQKCEDLFSATTQRDECGRYVVRLPFKTDDPLCKYGHSNEIARKRFCMLERRFDKDPNLKEEYAKVINEYLLLGHMEVVSNPAVSDAVYLPHHAVVRQDKTTSKVRVVFDASCKGSNGASLNSDLMTGPTIQPELRHLIMRWRRYPIVLVGDIVKMYRQVKVDEKDADFQRIYWRENPDEELQHLRLTRVTFGVSPAPFLAIRSLQQLAKDEAVDFPLAASRVNSEFYVDDWMSGFFSNEEGIQVYEEMTALLTRGGFPLQKLSSNSKELMKHIHGDLTVPDRTIDVKTDEIMKILGLTWNQDIDAFQCTITLPPIEAPVTKRRVISDIARLFDPLGWLAPTITTAKIFIQRLWLSGIEWDDPLPTPLLNDWVQFRNDLTRLTEIRIPRWIRTSQHDQCVELHGFSDASNLAYAAVVYMRVVNQEGNIHVSLVTSKTRVAPIKQVSIPRLELCGAVLLTKLLIEVANTLDIPKHNLYAWTDSTIVLAWLSSHPSRWKTFIANRVSEILTNLDSTQWSHVSSKDNPADCASRGEQPSESVNNELWNRGPSWLHLEHINVSRSDIKETTLEERKVKLKCHALTDSQDGGDPLVERFSSLQRLLRVLAWCRRFYVPDDRLRQSWLSVKELQDVMMICIKRCQNQYLCNKTMTEKKGKFSSLNPYQDSHGIWRVRGRLQGSNLPDDRKHPILIPRESHLAKLIIADAHEKTLHGGTQLVMNYIHSRYWIINLRNLVKSFIHKCVKCLRYSKQAVHPMMGQLPSARVTVSRPFRQSGLDYAGPIAVRTTKGRGHHSTKGYICLFVCMATRAIHLEVVSDLTSETFLAAFKRFVARRGHCAELWSDNGTTFVGADRELKSLFSAQKSSVAAEITDWLSTNGTTWHRIPPYSPNFGGLWEAGVKSTKHHLRRVIGELTLTFEELTTILAQIEACLNSRPICRLGETLDDPSPLTPGHFLVGEPLISVPDVNYLESSVSSLRRWQLTQRKVQEFWKRWSGEYLTQFLQRHKWKSSTPEPQVGDIVLVKEDDLPPARWLYGIVTEKHSGADGVTRVVSLRCKGNIIKRPVSKLCTLPVADS